MTKLSTYHDVTQFTGSGDGTGPGGPLNQVKLDAKTKSLVACNGRIALVVPVGGDEDLPNALIPSETIKAAANGAHEVIAPDGTLTINKKKIAQNDGAVDRYGDVFGVMQGHEPDLVIPLSLETLEPLVAYTKKHGTGGLFLCVDHSPGKNWQERKVTGAIQFMFDVTTGPNKKAKDADVTPADCVQAVGVLMPCNLENVQAVHGRLRAAVALANAGKTEKAKAAAARKKAADRKAAQTAAMEAADKKRKAATKCKAEEEEEDEVDEAPAATHEDNGKAKVKAKAKTNGKVPTKATGKTVPAATEEKPQAKAKKPATNGHTAVGSVADALTRAQASLSRHKFAAARRCLNTARAEIEAGNGSSDMLEQIDKLDLRISKEKAAFKKG